MSHWIPAVPAALSMLFALLIPATPALACEPGYLPYGAQCRPVLSPEFYYGNLGSGPNDLYPICGPGRVPVTGDGAYSWYKMASSGFPKSSNSVTVGGYTYQYTRTSTAPPIYAYRDLTRCACVGKTVPEIPQESVDAIFGPIPGVSRVMPDTFDTIYNQTYQAQEKYGMVAIATDNASDGRLGSLFNPSVGKSKCGCPNFNETPVPVSPSVPANESGVRCVPDVQAGPNRVLAEFDPAQHDAGSASIVMNRTAEPKMQSQPNVLVSKIALPRSPSEQLVTELYSRRIWTCAQPYRLDTVTKQCVYRPELNACDAGVPGSIPASEVSPFVTGHSKVEAFENAVNKKLSACLNEFGAIGSTVKFDCIDNSWQTITTFDDLWTGTDDSADGGQPWAIELRDPGGRVLTGFYSPAGKRCDQYHELAGDIEPGRLTRTDSGWTFTARGGFLPRPSASAPGVAFLYQKLSDKGLTVPQTPAEKAACPLLVRAAIRAGCPKNPILPGAPKTYEVRDASNNLVQRRCSVAGNVQVHVRIEQIFEIEGNAPRAVIDTVVGKNPPAPISVSVLTDQKYGGKCPPGTHNQNGLCVY